MLITKNIRKKILRVVRLKPHYATQCVIELRVYLTCRINSIIFFLPFLFVRSSYIFRTRIYFRSFNRNIILSNNSFSSTRVFSFFNIEHWSIDLVAKIVVESPRFSNNRFSTFTRLSTLRNRLSSHVSSNASWPTWKTIVGNS